jgi:hypothetical protein
MTARKLAYWCAAAFALAAPGRVYGQAEDAFCEGCYHDQQWFAPVDFDFDCTPIERECGYFFNYSKLSWATTGERLPIGTGGTDDGSLAPFRAFLTGFADSIVNNPVLVPVITVPPQLLGGIDSGPPRVNFGWGDRYEVGYFEGDHGYKMSILDDVTINDNQLYGLNTQDSLYGSVMIVFDDPLNLMFGYIDVVDALGGAFQPDGIADDIDGDGHFGWDGYDVQTPGRVPDTIGSDLRGDFDDLVRLPTSWQFLDVRNSTRTDGIELMKSYRLSNLHYMTKHQNNEVEVAVGVRYLRLRDRFTVTGFGGVMGFSTWDTKIDNNLVGPQIQATWTHQRNRLQLALDGRFLFGTNIQNFNQDVSLGEDLIPGQLNRGLYFVATVADHGKQEIFFSPTAELRAQASYKITKAIAAKLGYTAIFVDNISRSANQVRYELPRMGFRDDQAGEQHIFMNGVDFGFELVY